MEDRKKGTLYMLIVVVLWGFSFIGTKVLLDHLDPAMIGFLRFFMASLILIAICRTKAGYTKKELLYVALSGFFGITCFYMFENTALIFTTPTNASLIGATVPVIFLLTIDVLKRRFSKPIKYVGAFIAFVGVSLLILNGKFNLSLNPIGDILMLGAVFSWVIYTMIIEQLKSKDTLVISRDLTIFGTIFLLPFALYEARDLKFDIVSNLDLFLVICALLYLGVLCSAVGFYLWNKAIGLVGSSTTTNGLYFLPPVTILGDMFLLGNTPNVYVMVGSVLVLVGVYFSER